MKQESKKTFLSKVWRGICRGVRWFAGQFGYKRKGWFAKVVWGVFATSAALVMAVVAGVFVYHLYNHLSWRWHTCCDYKCGQSQFVDGEIFYHMGRRGNLGYLFNADTKEKTLADVDWIAPVGDDSLVCYSDGDKRGYFSKHTGKVVIAPKYKHAWIFSDGVAGVVEDDQVKFIDGTGKVVINTNMVYHTSNVREFVFHDGYCFAYSDDGKRIGLMDKMGKIVVPQEYTSIKTSGDPRLWCLMNDTSVVVLDKDLNVVIPSMRQEVVNVKNGIVGVTLPDHTILKYDATGKLVYDFCVREVNSLPYSTELSDFNEANLREYVAGSGYKGLMTLDGKILTKPLYREIKAIDSSLFLCTVSSSDKVIIDSEGNVSSYTEPE